MQNPTITKRNPWGCYHAALRRLLPVLYRQVSAGRYGLVLALCSRNVYTYTPGDSALGGTRHTRRGYRLWWRRMFRICAALDLTMHEVIVEGPPWDTRVYTRWTDHATGHDGTTFTNHGTHKGRMRWGRIVELRYDWDPDIVDRACSHYACLGFSEATAAPICD